MPTLLVAVVVVWLAVRQPSSVDDVWTEVKALWDDDEALIRDFARTDTGLPNRPPPELMPNLRVLRSIYRTWFEDIAVVSSAYRSPAVNAHPRINGLPNSEHLYGNGMDLEPRRGFTMHQVDERARQAKRAGVLAGVLNEGDHVHVETR